MREVNILEPRKVADGGREATGEVVTMEEDAVEGSGIEKLNRNRAMEEVSMKTQTTEID